MMYHHTAVAVASLITITILVFGTPTSAYFFEPAKRGQFCDHDKIKTSYLDSRHNIDHTTDTTKNPLNMVYYNNFGSAVPCTGAIADKSTCTKCAGVGDYMPTFVKDPNDNTKNEMAMCNISDLLTTKKELYIMDLLDKATAEIKTVLQGPAFSGGLKPSPSVGSKCGNSPGVRMPDAHASPLSGGEHFVIYITSGPDSPSLRNQRNRTSVSGIDIPPPLARGAACSYTGTGDGRPIAGHLHFTPANIRVDDPLRDYSDAKQAKDKMYVVHQLFHMLGFSAPFFRKGRSSDGSYLGSRVTYTGGSFVSSSSWVGETRRQMNSVNVRTKARAFFGCSTLAGAEDHETATDSHWAKRLFADDVMAEQLPWDSGVPIISDVTLAYLHDTSFWEPLYSGTTSREQSLYGKGRGCDFVTKDCRNIKTLASSPNFQEDWDEHCWERKHEQCSWDRKSGGPCNLVDYNVQVPTVSMGYFDKPDNKVGGTELEDFCGLPARVLDASQCDDLSNQLSVVATKKLGNVYHTSDSRCFTGAVNQMGHTPRTPYMESRCTKLICAKDTNGNNALFLELFNASITIQCPTAGGNINVALYSTDYAGDVVCPPYTLCTDRGGVLIPSSASTYTASPKIVDETILSSSDACNARLVCANNAKTQYDSDSKCTDLSREVTNCFAARCPVERASFLRNLNLAPNCTRKLGFQQLIDRCAEGLDGAVDLCSLAQAASAGALKIVALLLVVAMQLVLLLS